MKTGFDSTVSPESRQTYTHVPVLLDQVIEWLLPHAGGRYIDGTLGLAGHSMAILKRASPNGELLGIDADKEALVIAAQKLLPYGERAHVRQGRHDQLVAIARSEGFSQVDGVLLDLGISSMQLDNPERGFAFGQDGPLDMRMGRDQQLTAAEIVNEWDEQELADLIYRYGEERHSRRIAKAICAARPIERTGELAELIAKIVGRRERIHPATRTFQALRIKVNDELHSLESVLPQAITLLKPGGRLVVIAFHSLEDRIVKQFFVQESKDCICPPRLPQCICGHKATVTRLTRKPIRPSEEEACQNPRSRSARLRVAQRLGEPNT